jgi:2-polyprenyl-3-methyl-5-hydroxy-6-metoxy-1,4-benzoquinol methylase
VADWDGAGYEQISDLQRHLAERTLSGLQFRGDERLLDVGCGDGAFLEVARDAGCHVNGVDSSSQMVRNAHERGLDVELADALEHLASLPSESIDVITCLHVVEHLGNEQLAGVMAVGLMDPVCPPSSQFAAYNKIDSRKSRVVYPDFAHEHLPGWADREWTYFSTL